MRAVLPLLPLPARVEIRDGFLPLRDPPAVTRRMDASARGGREGYRIDVTPSDILLTASHPAGMAHAERTLGQLRAGAACDGSSGAPPGTPANTARAGGGSQSEPPALPCMHIEDAPRFPWRGFMLDESRHFQGARQVRKLLDAMALLKMNVFHWHLTDDQGWRMEIRKYPLLTEVGSRGPGTRRGFRATRHDEVPHGGFYTQAEIRLLVAYAAERHITVVPEIDMPGHSLAALAAYPRLGCTTGPYAVAAGPGIRKDVLCVGREATYAFMQDVLEEVMECFPGQYVHIGGDETPRNRWRSCPDCRRLARENGLAAGDVQRHFTNRIASFLRDHGRRPVGWDEILAPGLEPSAVAQCWRPGTRKVLDAVRAGRDLILSPFLDLYLDHSYSLTPLSRMRRFRPLARWMSDDDARHILGIEAPLWTELVGSPARLDFQVFPRLLACAETGWTGGGGDGDFERRVEAVLPSLEALGVTPAPREAWNPSFIKRVFGIFSLLRALAGGE